MIEFFASIDPVSLPVVAALLFSLTLYPLGLMLGSSCSPCCDTPCGECETGKLPDTVTVTFDGYPDVGPAFDALFVSFDSCYGFGATATPTTAGGAITAITVTNGGSGYATLARVEPTITADGPGGSGADITVTLSEEEDECGLPYWTISGLTVVDGGSGYTDGDAIVFTLGAGETEQSAAFALIQTSRDEPELTIEPPEDTGTGATFTVSLTVTGSNPQTWYISGITVTDGGTGYSDGDFATVGLGSGDVEQTPATLVILTVRDEPELTLSGPADLTVNVASLGGTPEVWEISSITVDDGGSGYSDGQSLNIILGPDDVDATGSGAYLVVNTVRDEPTLFAQDQPGSGGTGAVLVVNVVQSGNVWVVNSITVTNGGTGYTDGETFDILPSAGQTVSAASVTANVTGGVITSFTISNAGEYFLDTGVIDTVDVLYGGSYFKDTGVIDSIDISSAGTYYKALGDIESINLSDGGAFYGEDPDAPPLVADITVVLDQIAPSDGDGATFTVVVDDDPDSPTFGEITSVTVDNGGSGYEATGANNNFCMGEYMNGREFVLARRKFVPAYGGGASPESIACQYVTFICDPLNASMIYDELYGGAYGSVAIEFEYRYDTSTEPGRSLVMAPHVSLTTEEQIADCSDFELEFPANSPYFAGQNIAFNNVSATVVSGGGSVEEALDPVLLEMMTEPGSTIGACGSCCLNAAPTPVEVTVSIENLVEDPVTGSLADGDYVMIRDPNYEGVFPYFGNDNATIWRAPAAVPPFMRGFWVIIEPCATLARTGPGLQNTYVDAGCGDTCYKKCRLRILFDEFGAAGAGYGFGCDVCVDGPMCSPPPGSYTMVSGFLETPYYTATIA
jgi:hypothetical protein